MMENAAFLGLDLGWRNGSVMFVLPCGYVFFEFVVL